MTALTATLESVLAGQKAIVLSIQDGSSNVRIILPTPTNQPRNRRILLKGQEFLAKPAGKGIYEIYQIMACAGGTAEHVLYGKAYEEKKWQQLKSEDCV